MEYEYKLYSKSYWGLRYINKERFFYSPGTDNIFKHICEVYYTKKNRFYGLSFVLLSKNASINKVIEMEWRVTEAQEANSVKT
jgi:hypothetical protein